MNIEITQEQLDAVIEALEFAQVRCEQEAAALIGAAGREQDETIVRLGRRLGRERMEQAVQAAALADFFDSISDEEIAASAGKTYQDVTALRDPLAGLGLGGEGADPFERDTGDALTLDYKGQPRAKNGQFTYGKLGGRSTKGKKSGKIQQAKAKMSRKEFERVTSGFFTDHPKLKPGAIKMYAYGTHKYQVLVKGPGEYIFLSKSKLK